MFVSASRSTAGDSVSKLGEEAHSMIGKAGEAKTTQPADIQLLVP